MTHEELMTQALALPPEELAAVVNACLETLQRREDGWTPPMPVFRYVVTANNEQHTPLATATDSALAEQLQKAMGMTQRSTILTMEQFLAQEASR